jgi:hypothetical protein
MTRGGEWRFVMKSWVGFPAVVMKSCFGFPTVRAFSYQDITKKRLFNAKTLFE